MSASSASTVTLYFLDKVKAAWTISVSASPSQLRVMMPSSLSRSDTSSNRVPRLVSMIFCR